MEAEFRKKKGKGLSVLSGRDLYEFKREVFKDMDDDAEDGASVGDDNDVDAANGSSHTANNEDDSLSAKIQKNLFLDGGDVDLDDLDDD